MFGMRYFFLPHDLIRILEKIVGDKNCQLHFLQDTLKSITVKRTIEHKSGDLEELDSNQQIKSACVWQRFFHEQVQGLASVIDMFCTCIWWQSLNNAGKSFSSKSHMRGRGSKNWTCEDVLEFPQMNWNSNAISHYQIFQHWQQVWSSGEIGANMLLSTGWGVSVEWQSRGWWSRS